jgi:hypothetical protein
VFVGPNRYEVFFSFGTVVSLDGSKLDAGEINAGDPSTKTGPNQFGTVDQLDFSRTPGQSSVSSFFGQHGQSFVTGDFILVSAIPEPGPLSLVAVAGVAASGLAWARKVKRHRPARDRAD